MEIVQDKHTNQLHSKIKNGIKRINKQKSLSSLGDELSQVWTKKKEFLEQIERMGSNDKAVLLQMRAREYTIRPEINRTAYFRSHEVFRGDL